MGEEVIKGIIALVTLFIFGWVLIMFAASIVHVLLYKKTPDFIKAVDNPDKLQTDKAIDAVYGMGMGIATGYTRFSVYRRGKKFLGTSIDSSVSRHIFTTFLFFVIAVVISLQIPVFVTWIVDLVQR